MEYLSRVSMEYLSRGEHGTCTGASTGYLSRVSIGYQIRDEHGVRTLTRGRVFSCVPFLQEPLTTMELERRTLSDSSDFHFWSFASLGRAINLKTRPAEIFGYLGHQITGRQPRW